jgi:hypothetical protein
MALTTAQVTALADSIAKGVDDFNTNFITGTASARTSINNGVGGTGASATLGRVLAYASVPDLPDELAMLPKANTTAANVAAYMAGVSTLTSIYQQYLPLLDSLDTAVGGLNAYLTTNTLVVNAFFANAFNYYCTNAIGLGFRTSATAPTPIAAANFFPYAIVDDIWDITCSGATTFSVDAVGTNASTSVSGGGVAPIYIYKVNATNAVGGAAIVISYTNAAGATAQVTYNTVSGTPSGTGSLAAGFSIGATGSAITAVTGTGMTAAEQYRFGIKLVRADGY